jgi:hypothetical protein
VIRTIADPEVEAKLDQAMRRQMPGGE